MMYRELISTLSYMHGIICRGKGILADNDLRGIADGAHNLTKSAPIVEQANGKKETMNDSLYLEEAREIDKQIEEITIFLLSLEIV